MGPLAGSRYTFCQAYKDDAGRFVLSEREPYAFTNHSDTRVHVVVDGDTLFSLAAKYYAPLPRACGFWWVIADFQPSPLIDPSIRLPASSQILIPSLRVVTDVILSESRRRFQ